MKNSEVLKAAKAKIVDKMNWIQDGFARDVNGNYCFDFGADKNAVCWCSLGAIQSVVPDIEWDIEGVGPSRVIKYLIESIPEQAITHIRTSRNSPQQFHGYVAKYNDDMANHAEIMAMFDRAIELAEKDEQNEA